MDPGHDQSGPYSSESPPVAPMGRDPVGRSSSPRIAYPEYILISARIDPRNSQSSTNQLSQPASAVAGSPDPPSHSLTSSRAFSPQSTGMLPRLQINPQTRIKELRVDSKRPTASLRAHSDDRLAQGMAPSSRGRRSPQAGHPLQHNPLRLSDTRMARDQRRSGQRNRSGEPAHARPLYASIPLPSVEGADDSQYVIRNDTTQIICGEEVLSAGEGLSFPNALGIELTTRPALNTGHIYGALNATSHSPFSFQAESTFLHHAATIPQASGVCLVARSSGLLIPVHGSTDIVTVGDVLHALRQAFALADCVCGTGICGCLGMKARVEELDLWDE
ncbi:hypothetical protein DXG03_000675 [Asterophora parasitica]|uniref:Uncharacterized protein n=1 Tax=Asterophora parasitica TaxID=117018 RepID=A0A9P7K7N7_9AGAR|nr:hypothetical protein DXG03_000675 [Asterophora parasitica]